MKTLKVDAVYPMAFETFDDVVDYVPRYIEETYNTRRLHSALGYLSPRQYGQQHLGQPGNRRPNGRPPVGAHSSGGRKSDSRQHGLAAG
jgi:hypothetical protein